MRTLHAIFKLLVLVAVTAVSYIILLAGRLVYLGSPSRKQDWRNFMVSRWAQICAHVINLNIVVRGTVPQAPGYLVCNHLSYLDIPLLFTQLGCTFVAKAELKSWPVLGFLMKSVHTLFIDRKRKRDIPRVNALIAQAIPGRSLIAMFPEGTSSPGSEVLPFKPSLLENAARTRLPVFYATIHYATMEMDPPAYLSVCWWGDMTFPGHFFRLLRLRRIDATVEFGKQPVRNADRKQLATELWNQVCRQFVPVVAAEAVSC